MVRRGELRYLPLQLGLTFEAEQRARDWELAKTPEVVTSDTHEVYLALTRRAAAMHQAEVCCHEYMEADLHRALYLLMNGGGHAELNWCGMRWRMWTKRSSSN